MGDAAISAESASYNFPGLDGVARVQAQFLDMIADDQGDDGAVSDITPTVWQLGAMQPSDASWGSAFPTMAYQVWMTTGSTAVIDKHLGALVKYIDSLATRLQHSGMAKNNLGHCALPHDLLRRVAVIAAPTWALPRNRWISLIRSCATFLVLCGSDGDWFPPSNGQKGSTDLVSAATFIQDTRHVAAMAGAVGETKTQDRLTGRRTVHYSSCQIIENKNGAHLAFGTCI